jgi:hypothetical protein
MTITKRAAARFILSEGTKLGCRFGTDGTFLDFLTPRGMPLEIQKSFSQAVYEHREEIIAAILAENANG